MYLPHLYCKEYEAGTEEVRIQSSPRPGLSFR